ncbi:hypothetical protein PAMP_014007 [Pampus punctatissimus]
MLKVKKKKRTNKQMDLRDSRDAKKGHYLSGVLLLVSLRTAPVCVCVYLEFTILHIILPLFTKGHQQSDWSLPLFQVLGVRGQSPLSLPVSRWAHKHYSVGRKARNKKNKTKQNKTHCSPITGTRS